MVEYLSHKILYHTGTLEDKVPRQKKVNAIKKLLKQNMIYQECKITRFQFQDIKQQ